MVIGNRPVKLKQEVSETPLRARFKHRALTIEGLEDATPTCSEAGGGS